MAQKRGSISGFPEWLPNQQLVENALLARIATCFELHGFLPLQTRAVENLDDLLLKGETDKEIYVLKRLHDEAAKPASLGLHFDLTVPFARFVRQHAGQLNFPLRRYQIQKSWRGERPQEGRYREFYQADIDIVGEGELALHYDAELPAALSRVLASLPIPPVVIAMSHRKLLEGFYRGAGIKDIVGALRAVDKLDKLGGEGVARLLVDTQNETTKTVDQCLALAQIRTEDGSFVDKVRALNVTHELLDAGLSELSQAFSLASPANDSNIVVDLRIARGFDYYTGTVYEGTMVGHEDLGSVCSGGRYDNLVSTGKTALPGVGMSIGVSRILGRLLSRDLLAATRSTPSCVLVAVQSEETRPASVAIATILRDRGIPCEIADRAPKFGKQIKYAERRGIPYVWFPAESEKPHEVRDIRIGQQETADVATWSPPADDLTVQIQSTLTPKS